MSDEKEAVSRVSSMSEKTTDERLVGIMKDVEESIALREALEAKRLRNTLERWDEIDRYEVELRRLSLEEKKKYLDELENVWRHRAKVEEQNERTIVALQRIADALTKYQAV